MLGCVSVSALGLAGGAPSASLGPAGQLFVMPVAASVGGGIVLDIHSLEHAPAPARLTLYVPAGVTVDTSAAPGTVVGDGYLAVWLDAATTDDYAFGTIKAGDPTAAQTCAPGIHAAVWIASFRLSITDVAIPFYVDPTSGPETSLGAYRLTACLKSPYVPEEQGGAPFGLRVTELLLGLGEPHRTVIKAPATATGTYTWRLLVTPFVKGTATIQPAATFEARARMVLPHTFTEHLRYVRKTQTVVITGTVRLLGKPERRLLIQAIGGPPSARFLALYGETRSGANGSFTIRKRIAEKRRARKVRVYLFGLEPEPKRACVEPSTAPAGCVNESLSPPQSSSADLVIPKKH